MDSVTQPEPYTCKHGCERDLIMQAFADEANARIATALAEREGDRAEIARLREALEDIRDGDYIATTLKALAMNALESSTQ